MALGICLDYYYSSSPNDAFNFEYCKYFCDKNINFFIFPTNWADSNHADNSAKTIFNSIIDKWIKSTTQNFLSKSDISYQKDSTIDYFTKLFTHLEKYKTEAMLIYNANLFNLLKNEFNNNLINLHKKEYSNYKSYFLIQLL